MDAENHMSFIASSLTYRTKILTVVLFSFLISACQSGNVKPEKNTPIKSTFNQDSTVYFAKRTASLSLRASFTEAGEQKSTPASPIQILSRGYQLQFRSIQRKNIAVEQVSIIAGGKKITLTEKIFFVPANKGITLSVSLADTEFISQHNDAVIRFKYNGESQLMSIKRHQIEAFKPL